MGMIVDARKYNKLSSFLDSLPKDFMKEEALLDVYKTALVPVIQIGRTNISTTSSRLAAKTNNLWFIRPSKDKKIMRAGLLNSGYGRLGHIFDVGTSVRRQITTNKSTGRIIGTHFWENTVNESAPRINEILESEFPKVVRKYERRYLS